MKRDKFDDGIITSDEDSDSDDESTEEESDSDTSDSDSDSDSESDSDEEVYKSRHKKKKTSSKSTSSKSKPSKKSAKTVKKEKLSRSPIVESKQGSAQMDEVDSLSKMMEHMSISNPEYARAYYRAIKMDPDIAKVVPAPDISRPVQVQQPPVAILLRPPQSSLPQMNSANG